MKTTGLSSVRLKYAHNGFCKALFNEQFKPNTSKKSVICAKLSI